MASGPAEPRGACGVSPHQALGGKEVCLPSLIHRPFLPLSCPPVFWSSLVLAKWCWSLVPLGVCVWTCIPPASGPPPPNPPTSGTPAPAPPQRLKGQKGQPKQPASGHEWLGLLWPGCLPGPATPPRMGRCRLGWRAGAAPHPGPRACCMWVFLSWGLLCSALLCTGLSVAPGPSLCSADAADLPSGVGPPQKVAVEPAPTPHPPRGTWLPAAGAELPAQNAWESGEKRAWDESRGREPPRGPARESQAVCLAGTATGPRPGAGSASVRDRPRPARPAVLLPPGCCQCGRSQPARQETAPDLRTGGPPPSGASQAPRAAPRSGWILPAGLRLPPRPSGCEGLPLRPALRCGAGSPPAERAAGGPRTLPESTRAACCGRGGGGSEGEQPSCPSSTRSP